MGIRPNITYGTRTNDEDTDDGITGRNDLCMGCAGTGGRNEQTDGRLHAGVVAPHDWELSRRLTGFHMKHIVFRTLGQAKRLIVAVIGFTILAAGFAMIVLPGPAVIVIPVGLAVLASEFVWARKLLVTVKERLERIRKRN